MAKKKITNHYKAPTSRRKGQPANTAPTGEGNNEAISDSMPVYINSDGTVNPVSTGEGLPPPVSYTGSTYPPSGNPRLAFVVPPAFQKNPNKIMEFFKKVADYIRSFIGR